MNILLIYHFEVLWACLECQNNHNHGIWDGKSGTTIILVSDCFKKNKMTKFSKEKQNALFWSPFNPDTSKNKISGNIKLPFLRC